MNESGYLRAYRIIAVGVEDSIQRENLGDDIVIRWDFQSVTVMVSDEMHEKNDNGK